MTTIMSTSEFGGIQHAGVLVSDTKASKVCMSTTRIRYTFDIGYTAVCLAARGLVFGAAAAAVFAFFRILGYCVTDG